MVSEAEASLVESPGPLNGGSEQYEREVGACAEVPRGVTWNAMRGDREVDGHGAGPVS